MPHGNCGSNNGRWNGGNSEYKNHSIFKKNRLVKLSEASYKCETCGNKANHVHHIDNTKSNHDIKNLMALCTRCHAKLHHNGRPRKYGNFSLEMLAKESGVSIPSVCYYFKYPNQMQRQSTRSKIENAIKNKFSTPLTNT